MWKRSTWNRTGPDTQGYPDLTGSCWVRCLWSQFRGAASTRTPELGQTEVGAPLSLAGRYERLYIRPVFDWCNPFVTGSLLFVAPVQLPGRSGQLQDCAVFIAGFGFVALCSGLCCSGFFL